jgi:hypothetical protein
MTRQITELTGLRVRTATDLNELRDILRREPQPPLAAVLDLHAGQQCSGVMAYHLLHMGGASTPCAFYSGTPRPDLEAHLQNGHVSDQVPRFCKPTELRALMNWLRSRIGP